MFSMLDLVFGVRQVNNLAMSAECPKARSRPARWLAALSGAAVVFACFTVFNPSAQAADQLWIGSAGDHSVYTTTNWVGGAPDLFSFNKFVFGSDVVDGNMNIGPWVAVSNLVLTSGLTTPVTIDGGGLLVGGGTVDMSAATADLTINARYGTAWGDVTLNIGTGRTVTFNSDIYENWGNPAKLIKDGPGVAVLNLQSSYTLGTTVNGGTLVMPNGDWQFGNPWSAQAGDGLITVNSGATFSTSAGAVAIKNGLTLNGGTVSSRGLTYPGSGNWGNLYLGGFSTISAGGSAVSTISSALAMSTNNTFFVDAGSTLNLTGDVNNGPGGDGSLTKTGNGTLAFSGFMGFSGGLTVNGGTVQMTSGSWNLNAIAHYPITVNLGATLELPTDPSEWAAAPTLNGGTISSSGSYLTGWPNIVLDPGLTVTAGGSAVSTIASSVSVGVSGNTTFSVGSGSTLNMDGPILQSWIADRTGVIKTGNGTLTLSSAGNSYDCPTTISGGTLAIGGAGLLNGGDYVHNIINNAALVYGSSAYQVLSGEISGTGTLTQNAGTLVLSGANSNYTGHTTVNGGLLDFYNTASVGGTSGITVNGAYGSGGHLAFDWFTDGGTISTPISVIGGDYSWNMQVTVPNNLTFTGPITLSGGVLIVSTVGNSTVNFNNAFHGTDGLTFAALAGGANKNFFVLAGASDFTGDLALVDWNGSPQVTLSGGANRLPTTAQVRLAGSTGRPSALDLNGNNQTIAGLADQIGFGGLDAGARHVVNTSGTAVTLTLNTTADQTTGTTIGGTDINGTAGNNLSLVKTGTAKQTLTGVNTYTGATTIHQGTLALSSTGSIANSTTLVVGDAGSSGAVLDVSLSGGFTVGSTQTLKGIGTVNVGTGNTLTINGTHAPGNSPGVQSVTGNLSYGTGSIFEWDLASSATGDRGTQYDGVNVTGNLGGSGAIFKVVLDSGNYAEDFWKSNQSWTGIFTANNTIDMAAIFASIQWYQGASNSTTPDHITAPGYFSFTNSGNTLSWTAVPEPTSALAGLLLGAGLLRRRR